ncbi:glycosyltransferase family 2 protein [Rubrivivax gelatinosus]|uniref:Glycosyltransferase involved in cell wall biosynthesis n=1 Tax=Rubrivivax gelatinosus TaxID=28068 RepID=A0A4R2MFH0_RUBGE|nr:glycosyltransferase family 2 protein [Rubrivivax gelatinosus]TCO97722.1 glycosyltransferase involved in cell wall biosynthesis [Rubrivivax gelatinosus]
MEQALSFVRPATMADTSPARDSRAVDDGLELTILMPCLNEALTLPVCIAKARAFLASAGVRGEVLIADNGSNDGSQQIARDCGARVVDVPRRGYGAALIAGIEAAQGRYIVMGDSDDSYDFTALSPFLRELRRGAQLVMGNRFAGGIRPGAMPALHRYLGNPVLSFIGRLFFRTPIRDFHCGLRAFERDAMRALALRCEGMEFASEMVVKASLNGLRIVEVPTTLSPDGRDRPPHLRSWRDGWRHLRFLLLFSPRWLFLYPGLALLLAGLVGQALLLPGPLSIGAVQFDVHTMLYAAAATIVGLQAAMFAVFAKVYAVEQGILPSSRVVEHVRRWFPIEIGLLAGVALIVAGLGLSLYSVMAWEGASFGHLDPSRVMRIVIPSMTITTIGVQLAFAAMFLGVLGLKVHARK